jgi:serine/threonine protein kinase
MTQQEFQKRYTYNPATDKLGEGGFGSVFKAYDNHLDRWVALKISKVNPQYENLRLRREVEMVRKLQTHPNIARYEECYTFSSFDGEYDFGILQYYEEGNLSQLMKNTALTFSQKQSILCGILDGIEALHKNGIIHRDLKPQNILIVKRQGEYIPKITDFGISKQLDSDKSSIYSNSIAGGGTYGYASPEQLFAGNITKNTDLWSFGIIAFQVLTGQMPFNTGGYDSASEAGRVELFRQISNGRLPETTAKIAEPWQTLIRRCLVINTVERIKNTQEARTILAGNYANDAARNTHIDSKTQTETPKRGNETSQQQSKNDDSSTPLIYALKLLAGIAATVLCLLFIINRYGGNGKDVDGKVTLREEQIDVYVAGYGRNAKGINVAKLWKNIATQNLTDGTYDGLANSVYVSGNDVYVAGEEKNVKGITVVKLWKNGVAQNLTDGTYRGCANSVYVSGNDVYVAGYESNAERTHVAKLWKNGATQNLTDGNHEGGAASVYVSGNDVYVVGYESNAEGIAVAKLWKNGATQNLTDGTYAGYARSVHVSGNDVYVAGYEINAKGFFVAKLWKNGVTQNLTDGTYHGYAYSVYVSGNDVYVAGDEINAEGNFVAKLWKNGATQNLTDGTYYGWARYVYASGNDVYVAGYEFNAEGIHVAKLWKNGVTQNLTDGTYGGYALSVFVKKRE